MGRSVPLLLLLALAAPPAAAAQEPGGAPWTGVAGVRLESYSFTDPARAGIDRVSLLTAPLGARARVAGRAWVTLSGAFASARLVRADGGTATLAGLTDTELRVEVPVAGDWLTLSGTAVLPTGRQELSGDELEVAAVVASDLLPFAVSHWGGGQLGGAGVTVEHRFGGLGVGMSGGYRASRRYRAFEGGSGYRAGSESYLLVAVDHVADGRRAALEAGAHRYAHDELSGASLYRAGDRFHLTVSYAVSSEGRAGGVAYAGWLHRQNGVRLADLSQDLPGQDLALLGLGLRLPVGRGALLPALDARILHSGDGVGEGYGVGGGASAEVPVFGVTLVPSAGVRVGEVRVSGGTRSGYTGVELGLALRARGP